MSFLDHLRQKWKHSDPAVRQQAVRDLDDQEILEKVAADDPHEAVRLAAVERLTDQFALARFARGTDNLAIPAARRLTDRAQLIGVAQFAQLREVREFAVDRIDDRTVLHRIATSDTDPKVRWKARCKNLGADETREVIRNELSKLEKLELAQRKLGEAAEFYGTLDDVCSALIGDGRFRINGAVERPELGLATVRELEVAKPETAAAASAEVAAASPAARFLAAKRAATTGPEDAAVADAFFEIRVWRTDDNTFAGQAEEKCRKMTQNSAVWSRVSNGATVGSNTKNTAATQSGPSVATPA